MITPVRFGQIDRKTVQITPVESTPGRPRLAIQAKGSVGQDSYTVLGRKSKLPGEKRFVAEFSITSPPSEQSNPSNAVRAALEEAKQQLSPQLQAMVSALQKASPVELKTVCLRFNPQGQFFDRDGQPIPQPDVDSELITDAKTLEHMRTLTQAAVKASRDLGQEQRFSKEPTLQLGVLALSYTERFFQGDRALPTVEAFHAQVRAKLAELLTQDQPNKTEPT